MATNHSRGILVVAAMALAACGTSATREPAPPPGRMVLGTFTADVDLAAGTFEIRMNPPAGKDALPRGSPALLNLDASVTVANSGSAWTNTETPICTSGSSPTTWGATVTVKNNLAGTTLSGVYAEITSFGGATGLESCSSAAAPAGLQATYGLWSFGSIAPGATSSGVNWIFKYSTASQFSFSGRVVGVMVDPADVENGTQRSVYASNTAINVIAGNGTTVLVAGGTSGIDFVDAGTGAFSKSVATTGKVSAIAVAPTRVWYATKDTSATSFTVGWMDLDGTNANSVSATPPAGELSGQGRIYTIIPDPAAPGTKAWLFYNDALSAGRVWSFTITGENAGTLGTTRTLASCYPYSAALASDGRVYVPCYGQGAVPPRPLQVLSLATDPVTVEATYTPVTGCESPFYILAAGTTLYMGAGSPSNDKICTMSFTGDFTAGNAVARPYGLAFSDAGDLWAARNGGGIQMVSASPLDVAIPGGVATYALKSVNGYLWVTSNSKLWRVKTQ